MNELETEVHGKEVVPVLWLRWLQMLTIALLVFGMCLVAMPGIAGQLFGLMLFGSADAFLDKFSWQAIEYIDLSHGVLGAVMCGWSVIMLMIIRGPFRRGSVEGWNMIAVSVGLWYTLDTFISLWSGFWQNALLNTVIVVLFAIPLLGSRKHFVKR